MHYYALEPPLGSRLPSLPNGKDANVAMISDLKPLREIDYDASTSLISDRFKLLMGLYMPKYDFEPVVYMDTSKDNQIVFWKFSPPVYCNSNTSDKKDSNVPIAFTLRPDKGPRLIVVKLPVVESALRRGIIGMRFNKIQI